MVLATASTTAVPSSRMVLLKGVTPAGFVFFTNQRSRKGVELGANAACALLFPWHQLQRQVRVDGIAGELPREEVEAYFASRPRGAQIGAWASHQSQDIEGREALAEAYAAERGPLRGRRGHPAARGVGRLPRRPRGVRVLAGPAQPAARPPRLPPYAGGLGHRPPLPLTTRWHLGTTKWQISTTKWQVRHDEVAAGTTKWQ